MGVVRKLARTPGPSARVVERERFMALIGRGISNAEACRIVGVNRRTGTRWSHGACLTGCRWRRS